MMDKGEKGLHIITSLRPLKENKKDPFKLLYSLASYKTALYSFKRQTEGTQSKTRSHLDVY